MPSAVPIDVPTAAPTHADEPIPEPARQSPSVVSDGASSTDGSLDPERRPGGADASSDLADAVDTGSVGGDEPELEPDAVRDPAIRSPRNDY